MFFIDFVFIVYFYEFFDCVLFFFFSNKSLYEITQTLIAQLKEQPLSIKMSDPIHCLPVSVRGMTTLDRDLFTCFWTVPCVRVSKDMLNLILKTMKKCLLKLKNMMPVAHLGCEDPFFNTHKLILLNPAMYGSLNDFSEKEFRFLQNRCGVKLKKMEFFDLEMNYNNFSAFSIFKAVLPMDAISVSSYNIIGHIAHFNLKPEILDYKHVIGMLMRSYFSSCLFILFTYICVFTVMGLILLSG